MRLRRATAFPLGFAFTSTRGMVDAVHEFAPRVQVKYVPVGSNVPDGRAGRRAMRERLDIADDDIATARTQTARGFQHRVGLAHARAGAEKNAQLAPSRPGLFRLDRREQLIGIGARVIHRRLLCIRASIEREVQLQHVDARLAEHTEGAAFRGLLH